MKKMNILKLTLTLVLAFVVTGVFAQVADGNYVLAAGAEATDSVTVNKTYGYYAMPDTYFHPNYNAGGGWALTAGFTWTWNITGGAESGSYLHPTPPANYVEITWGGTAGSYTLEVYETADAAYGGCDDSGSPTQMSVEVIAAPTVTLTANNPGTILGPDAPSLNFCEGDALLTDDVQATLTTDVSGSPSYTLQYTYQVDTLDSPGGSWGTVATATNFTEGNDGPITGINANTYLLTKPSDPFVCETDGSGNKKTTRYIYTVVSVNDRISRKGDYLEVTYGTGNYSYYAAGGTATMTITVNPAPVTGPIYHISNMWAN